MTPLKVFLGIPILPSLWEDIEPRDSPLIGCRPWIQSYICPSLKLSGTFHHSTWPELLPKVALGLTVQVFIGCGESSTVLDPKDAEKYQTDVDLVSMCMHSWENTQVLRNQPQWKCVMEGWVQNIVGAHQKETSVQYFIRETDKLLLQIYFTTWCKEQTFFFKKIFIDFRERNVDVREKHRLVTSHIRHDWESNPQPFGVSDDPPANWAIPARVEQTFLLRFWDPLRIIVKLWLDQKE